MNKTIYVAEADATIWEKARAIAGGSLSSIIIECLRSYVKEHEGKVRESINEEIGT